MRVAVTSGALAELGFPATGSAAFITDHGEFKKRTEAFFGSLGLSLHLC